jgi:Holliday junction DNA helicase RuvA
MIRQIRGTVLRADALATIVDVGGLGFLVRTAGPIVGGVGDTVEIATHLAIKQDGVELYGFPTEEDRDFFELILSVPGIGPKTALSVLRRAPQAALAGAIAARDITYLTKIVGLGKKSAEKMVMELADKVGSRAHDDEDAEVFDTLVALGYSEREARKAIQSIPATVVGKDARLKASLSSPS